MYYNMNISGTMTFSTKNSEDLQLLYAAVSQLETQNPEYPASIDPLAAIQKKDGKYTGTAEFFAQSNYGYSTHIKYFFPFPDHSLLQKDPMGGYRKRLEKMDFCLNFYYKIAPFPCYLGGDGWGSIFHEAGEPLSSCIASADEQWFPTKEQEEFENQEDDDDYYDPYEEDSSLLETILDDIF